MRPTDPRPLTTGPEGGPESPFPIRLSGPVIEGFGRGSKELGIPTANIPLAGLSVGGHEDVESGVYYGFAGVSIDAQGNAIQPGRDSSEGVKGGVWPMVMSIGFNPVYKNKKRSVEVHLLHTFPNDFYGARMNLLILGFIRPEYDYVSKESLIEDIRFDIEVARRSLARAAYTPYKADAYLLQFHGEGHENDVAS